MCAVCAHVEGKGTNTRSFILSSFCGNGRFNALRSSERGGEQLDDGSVAFAGGDGEGGEAAVGQGSTRV